MTFRQNLQWGITGQIGAKGALFAYHLLLPYLLGLSHYGAFAFQYALAAVLLGPLLELGFSQLVPKWIARQREEVIPLALRTQVFAATLWLPIYALVAWQTGASWPLALALCVHFVSNAATQVGLGILRGREDLRTESILLPLQNLLALAVLALAWWLAGSEPWVGAVGLALSRFVGVVVLWRRLGRFRLGTRPDAQLRFHSLVREALSLGMVLLLIQLYFRIDTAMLGWLRGDAAVAPYAAAYTILEGTFTLPAVVMAALIGALSRSAEFEESFRRGWKVLSAAGLSLGVGAFVLGPWFFETFYPADFAEAGVLLRILAPVIPLVYWGFLTTQSLVALDRQRIYLGITSCGLLVNASLNWWWIPLYGAEGAAWATLVTEAMIPLACGVAIWRIRYAPVSASVSANNSR